MAAFFPTGRSGPAPFFKIPGANKGPAFRSFAPTGATLVPRAIGPKAARVTAFGPVFASLEIGPTFFEPAFLGSEPTVFSSLGTTGPTFFEPAFASLGTVPA